MTDPEEWFPRKGTSAITAAVTEADQYLRSRERLARRSYHSRRSQVAAAAIGALAAVVIASRNIELGGPWWMTALCLVIMVAWTLVAQTDVRRLREARAAVDEVVRAQASLRYSTMREQHDAAPSAPDVTATPDPQYGEPKP